MPSPPTVTTTTTTPDDDSDTMPIDAWDGDTEKMSAQSFLRAFHRDVKMYLVPGSEADDWFAKLPAATHADMDLIDTCSNAVPLGGDVHSRRQNTPQTYSAPGSHGEAGHEGQARRHDVWAHTPIRDVDTGELEQEMKEKRQEKEEHNKLARLVEQRTGPQALPRRASARNSPTQDQCAGAKPSAGHRRRARTRSKAPGERPRELVRSPRAHTKRRATRTVPAASPARTLSARRMQQPLTGNDRALSSTDRTHRTPPRHRGWPPCARGPATAMVPASRERRGHYRQALPASPGALKEAPAAVRMVGYGSYNTDDYGRPFGGDGGRFEEHVKQNAQEKLLEERVPERTEEAQGNSTGALPAPSREVPAVEREEAEDVTNEIYFLAREYTDEEMANWMAHTGEKEQDSENTRVVSMYNEARADLESHRRSHLEGNAWVSGAVRGRRWDNKYPRDTQRGYKFPA
ncbi:hypothetical protein B0H17DRAFT_1151494 [Mycena rosella]|uniref:Uncharacterized protein n=1 Tax=Mycena rosella TaxID=1033263 RepID=A0AAD7BJY3_MYCRO|nr:hypothetical protein B0H17DRAFT_1151494 [Mycena rosella]